ncbi:MAG: hypothetical protein IJQ98_02225 [Oscillospiraceae bacterium]|nr:hypothetical protein [Oscillospiraceae bacterium]
MSSLSTFGTFTMARLGIYVSQQALNVTGNNISNINTDGYSRQELDQRAMYYGAGDRFITKYSVRENGGVLATGVNQLRDQYLDIRYRNEMTKVGEMETKINGLDQVAEVFDEVAKGEDGEGVLEARFNDLIQQLENLSQPQNVGQDGADALVREAAEAITVQFNDYAKKLATLDENLRAEFRDNVDSVNATLEKIRDLNTSIRKSEIFGTDALVQRDERNLLIDKLSEQIGIHVTYEMEQVGNGVEVEKMIIKTAGDPGEEEYTLIDGVYGAQISIRDNETLGIDISELTSALGNLDPKEHNRLTPVDIQSFRPLDTSAATLPKGASFKDEETAKGVVDLLNADAENLKGENNETYRFGYYTETDGTYSIRRYDITEQLQTNPDLADATSAQLAASGATYMRFEVNPLWKTLTGDTELSGGLQAMRELLTEEGEYASAEDLAIDPNAGVKRGLPYYRQALDTLAREFAKHMNEANTMDDATIYEAASERIGYKNASGTIYTESELPDGANLSDYTKVFITADKEETTDPNEYTIFKTDSEGKKVLKEEYSYYNGGVLFSNSGRTDTTGDSGDEDNDPPITAANISVAYSWSHGMTRVLRSKEPNAQERSTEQSNIDHFISMLFAPHTFEFGTATEGTTYFKGTFQDMLTDSIAGTLAKDQNITKSMLSNYTATAEEINLDRDSVMGVDLNDEAMNMMMFQKAYSAACRLMTTYDGMLEKLINGTAV